MSVLVNFGKPVTVKLNLYSALKNSCYTQGFSVYQPNRLID